MEEDLLLGAILAGGRSRRYGRPKALALLDGRPLVEWTRSALQPHVRPVVLLAREEEVAAAFDLPVRGDLRPDEGPLGGVHTALAWAREVSAPGAFVLACDLPLVPGALVGALVQAWEGGPGIVPEAPGPWGVEPLCGVWSVKLLPRVEECLKEGTRSVGRAVEALGLARLPREEVAAVADPDRDFLSVNTPGDRREAEARLLAKRGERR